MPLYIFQSTELLESIRQKINFYGQCGPLWIAHNREGRETSLNYVLLEREIASQIQEFHLKPYQFRVNNHPSEGHTWHLFVRLNEALPDIRLQEDALQEKLKPLINFGLFKENDYKIRIPPASRMFNRSRGFGYLKFEDYVDRESIMITKLYLDQSYWTQTSQLSMVRCSWAKEVRRTKKDESELNS